MRVSFSPLLRSAHLGAHIGVLGVQRLRAHLGRRGAVGEREPHEPVRGQRRVARRDGVDVLAVDGPELVPLARDGLLARALRHDELAQRGHRHAAAQNAADGGEARVVPAVHLLVLHELGQLALGEEGVVEVEARKVLDDDCSG